MRRFAGLFLLGVGIVGVGCKSVPPPTPLEELNAQQMHGHAVYQAHCAACHYDRRSGSLHGPALLGM